MTRRGHDSVAPPSAAGAAIPSPSVTLWIMKPTIRNEPSVSCPKANEVPIASPSPKLCSPIPIATSVASATPPRTPFAFDEKRPEMNVIVRKLVATPSSTSPGPPKRSGERSLQLEGLEQRLDAEEREQSGSEGHERRQPVLLDPTQRREPEQAEAHRQHADEEADDPVAEEAATADSGRLDCGRNLLDRLDPGGARHADRIGSSGVQS